MRILITLLAAFALAAQCQNGPERPPAPPPPPPLDGGTACELACARLEQLYELDKSCPAPIEEGLDRQFGTADDVTCLDWLCSASYLDHEALAQSMSCAEWNE